MNRGIIMYSEIRIRTIMEIIFLTKDVSISMRKIIMTDLMDGHIIILTEIILLIWLVMHILGI